LEYKDLLAVEFILDNNEDDKEIEKYKVKKEEVNN